MKQPDEQLWVSLSDFSFIFRKSLRYIVSGMLLGVLLLSLYVLTSPLKYEATSSFREKATNGSTLGVGQTSLALSLLEGSKPANNSEAISVMESRMLAARLIKALHLQGDIVRRETSFPRIANIRDNLQIEYALFKNKKGPIFQEKESPVQISEILYEGEYAKVLRILFLNEQQYQVFVSKNEPPINGTLGIPFSFNDIRFTIKATSPFISLAHQEFIVNLEPLNEVIDHFLNRLTINPDLDDKSLLILKFNDSNRYRSAKVLNTLMSLYLDYLHEEQQRISDEQISYLQVRQDEMQARLKAMMNEHAEILSLDVANLGFPDVNSAIQFFSTAQQQYARDLLGIDLELKRLQQLTDKGEIYFSPDNSHKDADINAILTKIREMKRKGDSIELALGNAVSHYNVTEQFKELESIHLKSLEIGKLIALASENNILSMADFSLYNDPRYQVRAWCEQLKRSSTSQDWDVCKSHFLAYLKHLAHLFHIHERALQDQLTHQRTLQQEFQGIDLSTSQELYINYSKELNRVESDIAQKQFIINQMNDSAFEISSLSTALEDEVSRKMISQASALLITLKDDSNRSVKEQERLRSELEIQKGFISEHLKQTVQLLQLQKKLLEEKVRLLQGATLELIQQEIYVLEKHLKDYVGTKQNQLLQERKVIEGHQKELQREMIVLPAKWVSEKLIDHQMEMNSRMVEEITKLVESKSTARSLDLIQSAPIDIATPPPQPKSPRLLLFAILGGAFGTLLTLGGIVLHTFYTSMPVTEENLKLAGKHVSGKLSKKFPTNSKIALLDQDLKTMRHLANFLQPEKIAGKGKIVCLAIGSQIDYSQSLSMVLAKKGAAVLIIILDFDCPAKENEKPGLLQYLNKETEHPKIISTNDADILFSGGMSRFSHEAIHSERFRQFLEQLQKNYQYILLVTRASVNSPEADYLFQLSDYMIISITDQKWNAIESCIQITSQAEREKKLSFIFIDE